MSKQYIHYGSKNFEPGGIGKVVNIPYFTKPGGGMWASPIDAEYGWKEWNKDQDFRECDSDNAFTFTVKPDASIVTIKSIEDIECLPKSDARKRISNYEMVRIDFESMRYDLGVDAIELVLSNDRRLYWAMYGWDCDSILVMNPDIVVPDLDSNILAKIDNRTERGIVKIPKEYENCKNIE